MSDKDIDPKKFFDKKNYHTVIIKTDGESEDETTENKKDKKSTIVDLLTHENNKDLKEDALKLLKQGKATALLIDAIKESKDHHKKHMLVAAIWEANIDCKDHLPFFVDLALNDSYEVCLEALTVIEEMQSPFDSAMIKESLKKTSDWLKANEKNDKRVLIENLKDFLTQFIQ